MLLGSRNSSTSVLGPQRVGVESSKGYASPRVIALANWDAIRAVAAVFSRIIIPVWVWAYTQRLPITVRIVILQRMKRTSQVLRRIITIPVPTVNGRFRELPNEMQVSGIGGIERHDSVRQVRRAVKMPACIIWPQAVCRQIGVNIVVCLANFGGNIRLEPHARCPLRRPSTMSFLAP